MLDSSPRAAGHSVSPFHARYPGLNARAKVPELSIDSLAVDHLGHRQATLLVEDRTPDPGGRLAALAYPPSAAAGLGAQP